MKKILLILVLAVGLCFYFTWKPSTSAIVDKMKFGEVLSYDGIVFHTVWGNSETLEGFVRRIDRHYDSSVPVITYNLVLTTEEYNDPDIVTVRYDGGGNYHWSAPKQPKGSILFYHTIPASRRVQNKLDGIKEGQILRLEVKVSENSEIRSSSGAYVKLMHSNHKFILVEDVFSSGH
ncbi:MAG: hypothetical protein K9N35_01615 [Candidatus Marinimicrobia bacterium]|nr:hypothetical protein [Candidatus Neomarinimicrobiota bacterium]